MTLNRFSARRVTAAIRGGSSLPVVVDTAGGRFVAKLRGAAQGTAASIAEIVVGEIAEYLGFPVPERVLVDLDEAVPSDDRNDELADLLRASTGTNLGLRLLEGAVVPRPAEIAALDDGFAVRLLWLDALVMNPDRTPANPNLLLWKRQPWLIDHGAALTFQYDWRTVSEASPRASWELERHLFAERGPALVRHDRALAALLTRERLSRALEKVPDDFLESAFPADDVARLRQAYVAFLWKRLKEPRPFVPCVV